METSRETKVAHPKSTLISNAHRTHIVQYYSPMPDLSDVGQISFPDPIFYLPVLAEIQTQYTTGGYIQHPAHVINPVPHPRGRAENAHTGADANVLPRCLMLL